MGWVATKGVDDRRDLLERGRNYRQSIRPRLGQIPFRDVDAVVQPKVTRVGAGTLGRKLR